MATHSPQSVDLARRVSDIVARLRARGHRLTPQRYAVVRALVEGGEHPSAEQLFQRVTDAYPMMSPATVYKTLDTLKAAGEVLEIEFREGPNRYDATMPTPHPHAVCTACGRIDDVAMDRLDAAMDEAAAQTAYRVTAYRLDFYGLCPSCATDHQPR
ncbi:MAG: Fur family transcriptional regulator [Chloroflexota bacterium]